MSDQEGDWNFYLRILSNSARDSTDPASDPSILQSVRILYPYIENYLENGIYEQEIHCLGFCLNGLWIR